MSTASTSRRRSAGSGRSNRGARFQIAQPQRHVENVPLWSFEAVEIASCKREREVSEGGMLWRPGAAGALPPTVRAAKAWHTHNHLPSCLEVVRALHVWVANKPAAWSGSQALSGPSVAGRSGPPAKPQDLNQPRMSWGQTESKA